MINLTQHDPTPEQRKLGVGETTKRTRELLTFNSLPTMDEVESRAKKLAVLAIEMALADGSRYVLIGGAPYLMPPLEKELFGRGLQPFYAFSKRECVEEHQEDGSVKKTFVFRHEGFIAASDYALDI